MSGCLVWWPAALYLSMRVNEVNEGALPKVMGERKKSRQCSYDGEGKSENR